MESIVVSYSKILKEIKEIKMEMQILKEELKKEQIMQAEKLIEIKPVNTVFKIKRIVGKPRGRRKKDKTSNPGIRKINTKYNFNQHDVIKHNKPYLSANISKENNSNAKKTSFQNISASKTQNFMEEVEDEFFKSLEKSIDCID